MRIPKNFRACDLTYIVVTCMLYFLHDMMMMIGLRASRHRGQFEPITADKLQHTIEKENKTITSNKK